MKRKFSLKDRIHSIRFAVSGVIHLVKSQHNARIHLGAAAGAVTGGLYFGLAASEWCAVILSIFSVLAAEAMNTALEHLSDAVQPNPNPLIGKAKDLAAASVLLSALGAAGVGLFIFLPKLFFLFG